MSLRLLVVARLALERAVAQEGCTVERVDPVGKDVAAILQDHREQSRPVIFRDLTSRWRAHEAWDQDSFVRRYGNLSVRTEKQTMYAGAQDSSFAGLKTLEEVVAGPRTEDIVLSFGDGQLVSRFAQDLRPIPRALQGVLSEPVFTLGRKGTGADFHEHQEVWVAQVRGRKAWLLAPPAAQGLLPRGVMPCEVYRGRGLEQARRKLQVENCTVSPGEVLFLPPRWFHNTCNLDDFTIGVGGRGQCWPTHAACNLCDPAGLRYAVEEDPASLAAPDERHRLPIHACAAADCPEGVRYLVERGADASAAVARGPQRGRQPLHYTFCDKPSLSAAAAEALLELGADFASGSRDCGKVLHAAAFYGHLGLVERLAALGADPTEAVLGATPLQLAKQSGHAEVARFLRKQLAARKRGARLPRRQDL